MVINPYYKMILRVAKEERLTILGLQEKYDLGKGFASTVYRMKNLPDRVPHPATLGRLEEKVGIVIDDSDINNITYKRKDSLLYQQVAEATQTKSIRETPTRLLPLIEGEDLETIVNIIRTEGGINKSRLSGVLQKHIVYPGNCSENSVAGRVATDRNEPFIFINDIIVMDFDAKIENDNFAAFILKDGRWFTGRLGKGERDYIVSFYNPRYNPLVINLGEVLVAVKIVGIVRELH